ncbi:MAG: PCMD domain-containing protein [Paludibacter sp.]|nr:PCMD domain-containing protein [Paludibacter sp.]
MKHLILFLLVLCFAACQSGVLLDSEADIVNVILPSQMLTGKPVITNNEVRIPSLAVTAAQIEQLKEQLLSLEPQFELTPGAKILNATTPRDFTHPQEYTVVSEDGKWTKTYKFSFVSERLDINFFDFSNFDTANKYVEFYELSGSEKFNIWASGNVGFAITAGDAAADAYPTFATASGKVGYGAKLVTRSTGSLGAMAKMPFAAGNLFLGNFDLSCAMSRPLDATQFGVLTTMNKPVKVGLWCKYHAGDVYKNQQGEVVQKTDKPNIYAVLYQAKTDTQGKPIKLNGNNVMTDNSIICIAVLSEQQADFIKVNNIETDDYKYIEIPFEDRAVQFDPEKQMNGKYYFTIVFSSSFYGDFFEGAVGSTLCVDEVKIF